MALGLRILIASILMQRGEGFFYSRGINIRDGHLGTFCQIAFCNRQANAPRRR